MEGITTKEDIKRIVREENIEFIHLQFTDLMGTMKNVSVTAEQLDKVLENEIMFDGSSVDGFVRIEESDMYLHPDLSTFVIYPWSIGSGAAEARLICDTYNTDGTPFEGCPRNILKRAIKTASEMGYTMNVGPECEFYLFNTDAGGRLTLDTNDKAAYFDLAPVDKGEAARKDMVMMLKKFGFEIEAAHHEGGEGQHEIDFRYSDALSAADNIMTFKMVVRIVAQAHGLHATFMPKPLFGQPGSGMHINQSLFKGKLNAFYDPDGDAMLSDIALNYIAGLIKHAKALCAITNPTVNSYKRLVPEYEAPVHIAWSHHNRSPLIRVPSKRGKSTRIEMRSPDPSANPYLALGVSLIAGLDGITNKLDPPAPVDANLYHLSAEDRRKLSIDQLPRTLTDSLEALKADKLLMDLLGPHACRQYMTAKAREWELYSIQVSDWEIERYLNTI